MNPATAFIALGSNMPSHAGTPGQTVRAALLELAQAGLAIDMVSKLYSSPAWPDPADPPYVNAVARIRCKLSPADLLQQLHLTETAFGRTRSVLNAPRTLDLDIVDFDSRVEAGPPVLPHPGVASRAFVLLPLAEIAPGWIHPVLHTTIGSLIALLPDSERNSIVPLG